LEKRLPVALFLSFLVLFLWTILFPPAPEEPGAEQPGADPAQPSLAGADEPARVDDPGLPQATIGATEELLSDPIEFGLSGEPGHYMARFANRGGALASLHFGEFYTRVGLDEAQQRDPANWLPLIEQVETLDGPTGSLLLATSESSRELAPRGLDGVLWEMELLEDGASFRYGPGTGLVFTKRITFVPGSWRVLVELGIENESLAVRPANAQFTLTPAGCVVGELGDSFYPEPVAIAVPRSGESAAREAAPGLDPGEADSLLSEPVACAGVINKYFAFLLREEAAQNSIANSVRYRQIQDLEPLPLPEEPKRKERSFVVAELPLLLSIPAVGEARTWSYTVFAGPKEPGVFAEDFEPFHQVVLESDRSVGACSVMNFTTIGNGLLYLLQALHGVTGNWGVAIILLTLGVRLALFPINRRSQTAMARYQKKMKRVQPRLDESKKQFENDPQKQREAQAKIMQEEGAFPPLGGCLPMFLQLPVFFGLFTMLRTSFELRHQPFAGWITDLSRPDRLLRIDLELPIFGTVEYLNLLPPLMVVMWILQQKGMPQPTDEQAARMQKMMMFMPILFGFMLYNYAAGLSLYMLTTSTLGIFEQKVIKKAWPIDDTEVEVKKKPGCGPFSGFMEQLAAKQKEQLKRMEAAQTEQRRQSAKKKKRKR